MSLRTAMRCALRFKDTRINSAETIDLHGATPHVFRHTYISIAVAAGVDPKTVQAIAGHADIEITLEVYAHVRQKSVEEAGEKISLAMGHK